MDNNDVEIGNALTEENNEIALVSEDTIRSLIYVVRGKQVMLDSDLAMMYQVETRTLNQAVKRNITRFPERFRFQLTKEEYENLKSQIVISSSEENNGYGGRRTLPYVFTEQGISMLSLILSILVYTFFPRMFDLMLPLVMKHSIVPV